MSRRTLRLPSGFELGVRTARYLFEVSLEGQGADEVSDGRALAYRLRSIEIEGRLWRRVGVVFRGDTLRHVTLCADDGARSWADIDDHKLRVTTRENERWIREVFGVRPGWPAWWGGVHVGRATSELDMRTGMTEVVITFRR